jgi:hypothetical protein
VTLSRSIALVGLFATAALAAGDAAPPPGRKLVPVTSIVEAAEAFPDYVFFTLSTTTHFAPPGKDDKDGKINGGDWRTDVSTTIVTLAPDKPVQETGSRRSGSTLFAVPKAVADKRDDLRKLAEDVGANTVPGSAFVILGWTRELAATDSRDVFTARFRAERRPDGIDFVALTDADGRLVGTVEGGDEPSKATSIPVWIIAGVLSAVGIVLAALWIASRGRRIAETVE